MDGIPFEKSNFLRKPFGGLLGGPLLNALGSLEPTAVGRALWLPGFQRRGMAGDLSRLQDQSRERSPATFGVMPSRG